MQCHNAYGYQNSYNRRFTPGLPVLTFHGTSHHWGGRDVSASRHIALLLSDVIAHQRRYPAGTRPWDDSRRNLMGFPRTLTVTKILSATITSPMSKRIAPCTANRWPEFLSEALTALYLSCFSQVVPGTSDILCPEHPRRLKACDHTYASLTGAHALHKIWELSIVSTNKKNLGQNLWISLRVTTNY